MALILFERNDICKRAFKQNRDKVFGHHRIQMDLMRRSDYQEFVKRHEGRLFELDDNIVKLSNISKRATRFDIHKLFQE